MNHLKSMAMAGELCLQEAILTALAAAPARGLSVRKITAALDLEGAGCENMIRSHLERCLNQARIVRATRGQNPLWMLTAAERVRRGG